MLTKSVLPINSDGSVYHLRLKPRDLADTVIFVGDPDRVSMVSQFFDNIEIKKQNREFITHTGVLSGKRLSVISTGIGAGNIDIVMNEVDALHNIDFSQRKLKDCSTQLDIVRIGTCGALQESCKPGDTIVSQYAIGFDGTLLYYDFPVDDDVKELRNIAENAFSDSPINGGIYAAKSASSLCKQLGHLGHKGVTLTCSGFYGPQHRQLRIPVVTQDIFSCGKKIEYNGFTVANFEMETAMILGLGTALGHRCVSLSTAVFNRVTEQVIDDLSTSITSLIKDVLQSLVP